MNKNDKINLTITAMSSEGSGIGKAQNGMTVFVPLTAVGDEITATIVKLAKSYAFGIIDSVNKVSSHRIESDCPVFGKCGGCVYRHITYEHECEIKYKRVKDAFNRIGGFDVEPGHLIASKSPDHYRNKAQYPVGINSQDGSLLIGFYKNRSHNIAESSSCMLQPLIFDEAIKIIKQYIIQSGISIYDEQTSKGLLRHLYLRYAKQSNTLMVCLVINGNGLPNENLFTDLLNSGLSCKLSIIINSNREATNVILGKKFRVIEGGNTITDCMCSLCFELSPDSFYQVNTEAAEKLYQKASEYADLTGSETVIDLYCGAGTIGLSMAKKAKQIIGVDIVESSIKNARNNADINAITNARFICDDAFGAAKKLNSEGITPDIIIVDPPRKGCEKELLNIMLSMSPKKIIYISCDSATCARDVKYLCQNNRYTLTQITPVDMFPRTAHVETIVLLQRQNT